MVPCLRQRLKTSLLSGWMLCVFLVFMSVCLPNTCRLVIRVPPVIVFDLVMGSNAP